MQRSWEKSRREFLRLLGQSGSVISAERLASLLYLGDSAAHAAARAMGAIEGTGQSKAGSLGFTLVDTASQAGLGDAMNVFGGIDTKRYLLEEMGCGVAFFDYDNDGWQDIFLVNGTQLEGVPKGRKPSNYLFHNNRDGTFTDVTRKAGLARSGWGQGVCIGDYDNDGFDDLFVTYWGQNVLYHNNGDGTFTDVTEKAGLIQNSSHPRWHTGCCFVDYDRDGYLDLFVADYVNFDPRVSPLPGANKLCTYYGIAVACGPQGWGGGTNLLYHNRGDGTFQDVSEASGVAIPRGPAEPTSVSDNWIPVGSYGMSAAAADFDNDGWPDIYVSCDEAPSLLYHNNHDGTFTEVGVAAGCALSENGSTQGGMGIGVGDYDCDGWLDIVKPNFADENISLYHNNGDGTFYDAVFKAGLAASTKAVGYGAGFIDFDNDGWKDIFISTGHVFPEIAHRKLHLTYAEPKILYRNLGNGHFENVSTQAGPGVTQPKVSRGCAFGDFDNDGDMDVVVNNLNGAPSLLRNDCTSGGNWLKVQCMGTKSNRSAIGTRVRVVTGRHSQIDEVMSGSSYVSQNDFRLHFGLGKAAKVDLVEVRWPLGLVEKFQNLEVNQLVVIKEGSGIIEKNHFRRTR
jgi:hypothetical protein